jgi:shikimate dehydrogenase
MLDLTKIKGNTKICIIIGDPIEHSLSPKMHNAGYKFLGIDDEYFFLSSKVEAENLEKNIEALKFLNVRGITCTIPHKQNVIKYLDKLDETAKEIGAVNTVVNDNGVLTGYNTDWLGIKIPLEKQVDVKGKKVALIGAGGASQAVAYAIKKMGGELLIFNRTYEKAEKMAKKFGGIACKMEEVDKIKNCDIIINSTNVGMGKLEGQSLIPLDIINKNHIVFDIIYKPKETALIKRALEIGAKVIYGYEMLLYQGLEQFELYTGKKAPEEVMRGVLL